MQKALNIVSTMPQPLGQRVLLYGKLWLFASLSLLLLTGSLSQVQAAVTIGSNYIIIGGTNTAANGTYYTNIPNASASKGDFANITLGSFDRGTGVLTLDARATTSQSGNDNVQSVQLFYRVYVAGTTAPTAYTALNLDQATSTGQGGGQSTSWTASVSPPNLLTATSGGGAAGARVYTLDLYFQVTSVNRQGSVANFFDRTDINPYTTNFSVTGVPAATWTGTTSSDWFVGTNWSTGVAPTFETDATITLQSGVTRYPTITGVNNRIAQVRTLRLNKSSLPNSSAIILTINSGELQVYGDFLNANSGFRQNGGFFTLAGTTQTFDGAAFTDFRVQGGGTKTLTTQMDIVNTLTFVGDGGILATNTSSADIYNVSLLSAAQIAGENESSYVLGVLRANRTVVRGVTSTYGNVGIDVTASLSAPADPGFSIVTRRTGLSYAGVDSMKTNKSVERSFTFSSIDSPDDQIFTLAFHYLNAELNGLNAARLGFYRSVSGVAPFDDLNRASNNTSNKTVVSNTITGTLAATFTLGETIQAPLPVTLVSFTAVPTAQGGALLRWATATETNNKGFGIERQLANGGAWQQVGYLASGNNSMGGTYNYTDKSLATAPATPQAYYRLRQEDVDGKFSYSPVAVVARTAAVASTDLILSPVPVTGASLSLAFAESAQAGSEIAITNTKGQRMLSYTTQASKADALSLPVESLASGVYIVSVRVPGQAVRYARFVKM
jgi:hypothetical protein